MLRGRFSFEREPHIYRVGKWELPGTGELLKVSGHLDDRYYTVEGRDRGSDFADLTEALDRKFLTLEDVEGGLRDRATSYVRSFLADERPRWDAIEVPVFNRMLGIATIPDRVGKLRGPACCNIKTGAREDWHRLQRALEVMALERNIKLWTSWKRYTVYLSKKKHKLDEHDNPNDFDEAIEVIATWRKECHDENRHGKRRWFYSEHKTRGLLHSGSA